MYPRTLLDDDVKTAGEVKVFNAIRDGLGDGWARAGSGCAIRSPRRSIIATRSSG